MTFFKRQDLGRIYVLKMILPDNTVVHKIGMCHSNRSTDRMMEIVRSWFMQFRFVPYTELRLDMETNSPAVIESHIHAILRHKRFTPNHKVSGSTEMFTDLDELRVIQFIKHCKDSTEELGKGLSTVDYRNLGQFLSP